MQTALLKQGAPIPHDSHYTALHLHLEKLYFAHECGHTHEQVELAAIKDLKKAFKQVVSAFENAANHVFDNKTFSSKNITDEPVQEYISETYKVLKDSMQKGIAYEIPKTMQRALEKDLFVFSGMKAYTALREVGSLDFMDNKGTPKSWHEFKQDADKLNVLYNETYLQTEYNFVNHSALQASKWNKFEEDGDDYNLQYRTAEDDRVRPDHQTLAGTTLPPSDKFWDSYTPPNGWNCRCVVVQVRKEKYPVSDSETANKLGEEATTKIDKNGKNSMAIFRFNPGKMQKLIPPKHPYLSGDFGKLSATLKTLNLGVLSLADKRKVASAVDKCKARKEVEKSYTEQEKTLRKKYIDLLEQAKNKSVTKTFGGDKIAIKFNNRKGNEHFVNDMLHKTNRIAEKDLPKIHEYVKEAKPMPRAGLYKERNDGIKQFYYLYDKERNVYYHIAERPEIRSNGQVNFKRFLYGVTEDI